MAGIKRTAADAAFSDAVRERADWTCERCGKYHPDGYRRSLHCSHIFGRRHRGLRFDAANATALCYSCHRFFTENPVEHTAWLRKHVGEGCLEILQEKSRGIYKLSKNELADIAKHYREELKKMREKRVNGETGRLEFESWY